MSVSIASTSPPAAASGVDTTFPLWPRTRSTAVTFVALIVLQAAVFYMVTQPGFFAADDYAHFRLARERHFLYFLFTPILGVYPAPGHRLMTFLLDELFPLNFAAARILFVVLLAATTVILGQLVRTFARSGAWWTVALLAPFALSLTLLTPMWWWSNGLPVFPLLLSTAVALFSFLKSYTDPQKTLWIAVTVIAIAAAGAFYIKFLLIPVYLLLFRLWILPRLLDLSGGIRALWEERTRWIAFAVPPAAYLAVFVFSGLAGRTVASGERPFFEYFAAAWFHALVPASFLNAEVDPSTRFSIASWVIVLASQLVFLGVLAATLKRTSLALWGWAIFVVVFAVNAAMVGASRLASFGVLEIAYPLRYYPEIVFFLPLSLALGLRQGAERRPQVAWEKKTVGKVALVLFACLYAAGLIVWAPRIVSASEGAQTRVWFDNLQTDLRLADAQDMALRVLDSDTPEYVMPPWMGPYNRVSTILWLLDADVVSKEVTDPTYLVRGDGRLAEAMFQTSSPLVGPEADVAEGVEVEAADLGTSSGVCMHDAASLRYRPPGERSGRRLALRLTYAERSAQPAVLEVETSDPDRGLLRLDLRPDTSDVELLELGTSGVQELTLRAASGDELCLERLELGSLSAGAVVAADPRLVD